MYRSLQLPSLSRPKFTFHSSLSVSHSTSCYWWHLPGFILPQYLARALLGEIFSKSFLVTLHFTRLPWLKWVWAWARYSTELIFIMVFKDILYMQILSFYQIFNREMGAQFFFKLDNSLTFFLVRMKNIVQALERKRIIYKNLKNCHCVTKCIFKGNQPFDPGNLSPNKLHSSENWNTERSFFVILGWSGTSENIANCKG